MGFASLVEGLDVPRSTQLLSLLGRNIGIEIGQTTVVLLLFPGLFLLRRTRYFKGFFSAVSILLAAISVGWMIERLFTVELRVSSWVDPVVELPRALIFRIHGESGGWPPSDNPTWTLTLAWLVWTGAAVAWIWFRYRRLLVRR